MASRVTVSFGGIPELPVEFGELSRVAQELRARAGVLPGAGAEAASAWDGLEAVYQAPETEELVAKMRSLVLVSADVGEALVRAADIIDQLADDLVWLAMQRRGLVDDAEDFLTASRGIEDRERASELEAQIELFATDVEERLDQARSDLEAIAPPPPWEVAIPDASPPPLGPRLTWSARTETRADDLVLAPLIALARADTSRVARLLAAHPEWAERLRARPPSPEVVRAWWDTLGPGAVAALIDGAPVLIGALGGVPPLDRVAANRVSARARLREVEGELPGWEGVLQEGASADLQADRRAKLDALRAERDYLRSVNAGEVKLYLYEPADNRIIEMLGTPGPETTRILAYVPGTFTRVDSFYRGEVQSISKWMTEQESEMVAFVWKGTDFPGDDQYPGQTGFGIGLLEANDPDRAAPAGEALARFRREVSSDPSLAHGLQLAAGHSWGLVPITASEMRGVRYAQVHSLSGAWVPDGWAPHPSTSYSHWSYTDALSMAQDGMLVNAGRAPDTVSAFESHIYERKTDAEVPLGGDLAPFLYPDGPTLRVSLSPLANHNLIAGVSEENKNVLNDLKEGLMG
ncbi:hypothetical protein MTES_3065 [Microbacterium testaceum StLB037]|uniref:Uncharacterized protein n=1 Tax=Microbacterium testaceum (strain StLB037) TaxID=979556 RepID=E8NBH2_MICTS|nr:hypothetical protein MTES_3065 [Microbacterium testaceum StLB037]